MSVVKSKRSESGMAFIDNARELELFTLRRCAHFPKRYTFLVSGKIADIAISIYENAVAGNELSNIQDDNQYLSRLHHFRESLSQCNVLVSQIQLAADLFGIPYETMQLWMALIDKEERLLQGIIRKDIQQRKPLNNYVPR